MIVPMLKVLALVYHQSLEPFLASLKELGVMHIDVQRVSDEKNMLEKAAYLAHIQAVIKKMQDTQISKPLSGAPDECLKQIEALTRQRDEILVAIDLTAAQIKKQQAWGDFDPQRLKNLYAESGIKPRLFVISQKKFTPQLRNQLFYAVVREEKKKLYIIVFEKDMSLDTLALLAEEQSVPEEKLSVLVDRASGLKKELGAIEQRIRAYDSYKKELQEYFIKESADFEFISIVHGLPKKVEGSVYVLNGWIPRSKSDLFKRMVQQYDAAYELSKPHIGDPVPVLLTNNPFARLFEPIAKLFDLPHYQEIDLTPLFAPFFMLFFGMCTGDAGYGLIIIIASIILRFKLPADKKGISTLGILLGCSTLVVGFLTGGAFGFNTSKVPLLQNFVAFDQQQLFNISLVLGLTQILFGLCIKAVNMMMQYGFMYSLSTIGWLMLIIGGLVRIIAHMTIGIYAVYAGVFLILFFNDLKANIFVRFGKGLWELYNITGVFGDVLSYVRLFALGLSSTIMGFVINQIASQIRELPWIGFPLALIFFFIGHAGNLCVVILGSFVHPLRLTFVEFYKNAGFAGGGKAYRPFGKLKPRRFV